MGQGASVCVCAYLSKSIHVHVDIKVCAHLSKSICVHVDIKRHVQIYEGCPDRRGI